MIILEHICRNNYNTLHNILHHIYFLYFRLQFSIVVISSRPMVGHDSGHEGKLNNTVITAQLS